MMHKYYADNVTLVSGDYEPPVVGWQNYAAAVPTPASGISGHAADPAKYFIFSAETLPGRPINGNSIHG